MVPGSPALTHDTWEAHGVRREEPGAGRALFLPSPWAENWTHCHTEGREAIVFWNLPESSGMPRILAVL